MKFAHIVNHNGVWYPAGTEVPVGAPKENAVEPEKPGKPLKRDIMLMKKADLIALAEKNGIKHADTYSGAALKEKLIELYSL